MKKETICAFSGFDGQLLKNGVALANEKVIRQYEWADEVHREEATTDENGYFSFESAWEDYEYKIEFNFCVPQEIRATDDLIPIFGGGKLRKHEFSEFNDRRCLVVFETTKPLSNWDIAGNQSLSNGIIKG